MVVPCRFGNPTEKGFRYMAVRLVTFPSLPQATGGGEWEVAGLVWFGLDWIGLVWIGLDWIGLVWFGLVWFGERLFRGFGHDCLLHPRSIYASRSIVCWWLAGRVRSIFNFQPADGNQSARAAFIFASFSASFKSALTMMATSSLNFTFGSTLRSLR